MIDFGVRSVEEEALLDLRREGCSNYRSANKVELLLGLSEVGVSA